MTLPDISRLEALPHDRLRAFGQKLAAIGVTRAAAQPALDAARGISTELRRPAIVHHLRRSAKPAAHALRVFMFDDPVTAAEARAAFGEALDELLAAGLVERRGEGDALGSPFVL